LERKDGSLQPLRLDEWLTRVEICLQMLDGVRQANAAGDAAQARAAAALDDPLDARLRGVVSSIREAMRVDVRLVENGSRMLWITHNLERCGARTKNIAEQLVYRLDGVVEELD
jgi:phosphate uptake regulator